MSSQTKRPKKLNPFLKFFKVLSATAHGLPYRSKRIAFDVCVLIIVAGILISAIAVPAASKSKEETKENAAPAQEEIQPPTEEKKGHKIEGIPIVVQDYYKAGCETYACTMLLQGLGFDIDEHRFINEYLIQRDFSYDDAGNFCGPEMNSAFAGDLFTGAGIFCPGMAKSMNLFLEKQKTEKRAKAIKGKTLAQLCEEYIDRDVPVMTWVTTYMEESYEKLSWVVDYVDENAELKPGETMAWRQNEHCMVLVGYTDTEYIFNDSVAGKVVSHDKALAETRFMEIGQQAVVVE